MNIDLKKCFVCGNNYKLGKPYFDWFQNKCFPKRCESIIDNHSVNIVQNDIEEILFVGIYLKSIGSRVFNFFIPSKKIKIAKLIDSHDGKQEFPYFEPDFSDKEKLIRKLKTILIFG